MEYPKMAHQRTIYIRTSSSIANFREKLKKRMQSPEWKWYWPFGTTIFFGCYHIGDYLRILWHRGERRIFWCGSDLLQIDWLCRAIMILISAKHFVENKVEWDKLRSVCGVEAEIIPMIFDDPDKYKPCCKYGNEAWMTYHKGREEEYGVEEAKAICKDRGWNLHLYDGTVPEEQFNEEIKNYQIVLRLNKFDGFAESLAKGILLDQDFVSAIEYPKGQLYWRNKFKESLWKLKY